MLFRQFVSPKVGNLVACALTAAIVVSVSFSTNLASAQVNQVIIDSDGFESTATPSYSTGALEGQSARLPGDATTRPWYLLDDGTGLGATSTADVEATTSPLLGTGGNQRLRVDRKATDVTGIFDHGSYWGVPVDGWPQSSARYVCIEWDMLVEPTNAPAGTFGPFFGIEAYADGGAVDLLGGAGVDATTGEVLFREHFPDNNLNAHLIPTPNGDTVVLGDWNHFHLDFDYQNYEYSLYLNDPLLANPLFTLPFVGDPTNYMTNTTLNSFADAPITTFAAAGNPASLAQEATAFFDNYIVYQTNGKIPEPTTLALGLIALVSIQGLSRRRSS